MGNYGWTNEAGEPIMDGAAYRFEQQLDMDSSYDYALDTEYGTNRYDNESPCSIDQETCTGLDLDYVDEHTGECSWCGKRWPWDWSED